MLQEVSHLECSNRKLISNGEMYFVVLCTDAGMVLMTGTLQKPRLDSYFCCLQHSSNSKLKLGTQSQHKFLSDKLSKGPVVHF